MFDKKTILITGGTGSLGRVLARKLLGFNVDAIRIFSRNEGLFMGRWKMVESVYLFKN